jgi:sec-independent protein translocase protein TatA
MMPGSLGLGEILVILIIALIVFGPRRLPEMGRSIGKSVRELRKAAADLRAEIEADIDIDDEPPRAPMRTPGRRRHTPSSGDGETPDGPARMPPD